MFNAIGLDNSRLDIGHQQNAHSGQSKCGDDHVSGHVCSRRLTCAFNGAKPASEAPLAERPVQGMVRRHLHSEARATIAAGVPESNDHKLSSAHVVVDVVPDP